MVALPYDQSIIPVNILTDLANIHKANNSTKSGIKNQQQAKF